MARRTRQSGPTHSSGPAILLYHSTDVASALKLLNGAPLDAGEAQTAHIDGALGFYLATLVSDAEYFALRRQGTILEYMLSSDAVAALLTAGVIRRPIPAGKTIRFAGDELFVPPEAFSAFNRLVQEGKIRVRPYRS
ncbi:MAG: hypothetical protein HY332_07000 [Chloroflexi bacterium]|nr:hypothetical protein [Chloroflexota bacterium]